MAGLQQLPDLASLAGLDPYLNQAGMAQIAQARQFNDVGLQQNQADLQAKTLANMFAEQNNPQLLQSQALANEGAGYLNSMNKVKADQTVKLAPEAMEAERANLLAKASEAQLNSYLAEAQKDLVSGDPQRAQKGRMVMEASWGEITRRAQEQQAIRLKQMDNDSEEKRTRMSSGATVEAARIGADSRKAIADLKANSLSRDKDMFEITKGDPTKMAGYYAKMALEASDPDEKNRYMQNAAQMERLAQTTSPAVASQGGKIDTAAETGMAAKPVPSAFNRPPAPAAWANVPKANIPPPVAGKVRVLNANGQPGYISADQRNEAIKRGDIPLD